MKQIFDFSRETTVAEWSSIDDRIMGGESLSQPAFTADVGLSFRGNVSLANNGGFASIRSDEELRDLSGFSGLCIRLRGDGKRYKISLRTDRFYDGISYQASFDTQDGTWEEITLPFDCFSPTHHGLKLKTVAPLDTSQVQSFGLFIADRQDGPFRLDIAWIKAT